VDVAGTCLHTRADDLRETPALKVRRHPIVQREDARYLAVGDETMDRRPALRFAVVVRTTRAGQPAEAWERRDPR
jgi:hypothetical protein